MILYLDNTKDSIKKLPEVRNEFGEVAGYKNNTPKSVAFLYPNTEVAEREIKKTIPGVPGWLSVKHSALAQVIISWFMGLNPALGSVWTAQGLEPALDSVSPALFLPHLCTISLKSK